MTAGEAALAGSPESVQQIGASTQARSLGGDVARSLQMAVGPLGGQSGNAVSVDRITSLIHSVAGPANMIQGADASLGSTLAPFGAQMADIAARALRAQSDLATSERDVAIAQNNLDSGPAPGMLSDALLLTHVVESARERAVSATRRLQGLDEERRGVDASQTTSIADASAWYVQARSALAPPPRVSASVRVAAQMPDGATRSITAMELAKLGDAEQIRAVWNQLNATQRQQLIDDSPLLVGNLDGIPLRDRNTANVITAHGYRSQLEHQIKMYTLLGKQVGINDAFVAEIAELRGQVTSIDAMLGDRNQKYAGKNKPGESPFGTYRVYNESGTKLTQNGLTLVGFNPMRDSYITFQGALDPVTGDVPAWMDQVGVVIPGTNSRLGSFTADLSRGRDLYDGSGKGSGYFTWHGAPMPEFDLDHIVEAGQRGFADVAAPRLASFVNNLALPPNVDVVPIAHSYGAAVLGAAEFLGLRADRVVYVAPAGLGHNVSGIDDFPHTKHAPHFVLQARNDIVVGWNQGKIAHGPTNPLHAPGITRLETGYLDANDPSSGTIESPGWIETHSTPFTKGSTSMENITGVVQGKRVSLYHPDIEFVSDRGAKVRVPDSGAAQSAEHVSSINLEPLR